MMKRSANDLAKFLGVVGGLLIIVSGFLAVEILGIILGLIAIFFSLRIKHLLWTLVVLIVGLLAYEFDGSLFFNFGPILVILAGIIALAARII